MWNVKLFHALVHFYVLQSSSQEKITKLARTEKTALLYAADQTGYIYVYDTEGFGPEQKSPKGNL